MPYDDHAECEHCGHHALDCWCEPVTDPTACKGHVLAWDVIDPLTTCLSPEGHNMEEIYVIDESIPLVRRCGHCGADATIVTFPKEQP